MSTLLIAVKSCHEHRAAGYNEAIRRTWGTDLIPPHRGVIQQTLRFFHGQGGDAPMLPDEIALTVDDSYEALPHKTRDILRCFLHGNWDFIFLCDTDTFCLPKLFKDRYDRYDIAGYFPHTPLGVPFKHEDGRGNVIEKCYAWPSGGIGYFLSRQAASFIVQTEPMSWAEDLNIGLILGPYIEQQQLSACSLDDFFEVASWHFSPQQYRAKYNPTFKWQDYMFDQKRSR